MAKTLKEYFKDIFIDGVNSYRSNMSYEDKLAESQKVADRLIEVINAYLKKNPCKKINVVRSLNGVIEDYHSDIDSILKNGYDDFATFVDKWVQLALVWSRSYIINDIKDDNPKVKVVSFCPGKEKLDYWDVVLSIAAFNDTAFVPLSYCEARETFPNVMSEFQKRLKEEIGNTEQSNFVARNTFSKKRTQDHQPLERNNAAHVSAMEQSQEKLSNARIFNEPGEWEAIDQPQFQSKEQAELMDKSNKSVNPKKTQEQTSDMQSFHQQIQWVIPKKTPRQPAKNIYREETELQDMSNSQQVPSFLTDFSEEESYFDYNESQDIFKGDTAGYARNFSSVQWDEFANI